MGLKEIRQKTQFVQNIIAKEKALGRTISRQDAEERYHQAVKDKARGGAKVAKTPKSATPRETILGVRPRTKRA